MNQPPDHHMHFPRTPQGMLPSRDNHPLLAQAHRTDPQKAEDLTEGLRELISHEDDLFAWLAQSEEHAAQLAHDPVGALRTAMPRLAPDFLDEFVQLARSVLAESPRQ